MNHYKFIFSFRDEIDVMRALRFLTQIRPGTRARQAEILRYRIRIYRAHGCATLKIVYSLTHTDLLSCKLYLLAAGYSSVRVKRSFFNPDPEQEYTPSAIIGEVRGALERALKH